MTGEQKEELLALKQKIQLMLLLKHGRRGCDMASIMESFARCFGHRIDFLKFGYTTVQHFLKENRDNFNVSTEKGTQLVKAVPLADDGAVLKFIEKMWTNNNDDPTSSTSLEKLRIVLLLKFPLFGCQLSLIPHVYRKFIGDPTNFEDGLDAAKAVDKWLKFFRREDTRSQMTHFSSMGYKLVRAVDMDNDFTKNYFKKIYTTSSPQEIKVMKNPVESSNQPVKIENHVVMSQVDMEICSTLQATAATIAESNPRAWHIPRLSSQAKQKRTIEGVGVEKMASPQVQRDHKKLEKNLSADASARVPIILPCQPQQQQQQQKNYSVRGLGDGDSSKTKKDRSWSPRLCQKDGGRGHPPQRPERENGGRVRIFVLCPEILRASRISHTNLDRVTKSVKKFLKKFGKVSRLQVSTNGRASAAIKTGTVEEAEKLVSKGVIGPYGETSYFKVRWDRQYNYV